MLPFAASLFLFLAIATAAVAVFRRGPGRSKSDARIRALRAAAPADDGEAVGPMLRRSHSSIPAVRGFLGQGVWAESASHDLRSANIHLRVGEYLLGRLLFGLLVFVIVAVIARFNIIGLVLGCALGGLAYLTPPFFLHVLHRQRVSQIEKQLVELSPMLASALRSGFALGQGLELAARQIEPPLGEEIELMLNDVNLGAPMDQALLDMGRRIGSSDLDMLITAIMVQRTTGGNLAEILDQSAETLRERERVRGELNTLTAHQRLTGVILSIYPIGVGLLLFAIMPSMWSVLFTENAGRVLLGVALGLQGLGFLLMRRVMNIRI
jgi:tight adherence protein B